MIEPEIREIETPSGEVKKFTISKFNAIAGREIVSQYPISGMPKLGDYATNEAIMLKMMAFVAVQAGDVQIPLTTRELVNNHVPDWETLARLEMEVMQYNCSFFGNGKVSGFLDDLTAKLPESILSILIPLLERFSLPEKQPSKS